MVGRYGASLTSDDFWRSPVIQNQAAQLRPLAEDLARRHSPVSAEELATLTVTIAPELERFRRASANGGRGAALLERP